MSMPNLHRAALWYARHGWHIFPLRPWTKEPFAKLGVYQATTNLARISAWWRCWPQANIGLHCGGSGILALDADAYKDTYAGDSLLSWENEETVTNLTGGGGTHLLFRMPDVARYGNATGQLPAGVDVRGYGGYIVLPPSIHPNGRRYQWEAGYGPHEIDMKPLPGWLKALLGAAGTRRDVTGSADSEAVAVACAVVESVLGSLGLEHFGRQGYGNGRKWILRRCPFNPASDPHPADKAAFVVVLPDGAIRAGCQHQRCRQALRAVKMSAWQYITRMTRAVAI